MPWRYIISTVLGCLLVFGCEFVWDHFDSSNNLINNPINSSGRWMFNTVISVNSPTNSLVIYSPQRQTTIGKWSRETEIFPSEKQKSEWQLLSYQLIVLDWLQSRGANAFRTAAVAAFILSAFLYLATNFHPWRAKRKTATGR